MRAHRVQVRLEFKFDDYTSSVNLKEIVPDENGFYKATCNIPAAYMAHKINAVVYINGVEQTETSDYSVQEYAETILADPEKYDSEKPEKLAALVKEMLNYGEKAQAVFSGQMKTTAEYHEITGYYMADVTAEMIQAAIDSNPANAGKTAADMSTVQPETGATYYTTSLIFLSNSTLRHYFAIPDGSENPGAYDGNKLNYFYYVEKTGIAAKELDDQQEFTVNEVTFYYSALDYAKAVINSNMADSAKDLAKSLYLYNKAANAYFDVVEVDSVALNKTSTTIGVGKDETLTATVSPADATDPTVTWTSSDESIATVDENGKVTAIAEGTAIITATAGEKTATCTVNVIIPITSLTLNWTDAYPTPGDGGFVVYATISPDNATIKNLVWSCDDDEALNLNVSEDTLSCHVYANYGYEDNTDTIRVKTTDGSNLEATVYVRIQENSDDGA